MSKSIFNGDLCCDSLIIVWPTFEDGICKGNALTGKELLYIWNSAGTFLLVSDIKNDLCGVTVYLFSQATLSQIYRI